MADVDPYLVVTTGATAASAWAGRKLLGPLFDELAQDLRQRYAERRARNVLHIVESAARMSGHALNEPGTIPPRMLGLLLDEGSWCDDEVMAEYWAGILSASRTSDGRDDRGTTWVKLVSHLSSVALRMHFLLYTEMRRAVLDAPPFDIGKSSLCDEFTAIYVPRSDVARVLALDEEIDAVLAHAILGLRREGLISDYLAYGPKSDIEQAYLVSVPEDGLVASASYAGIELFFWGHGFPNLLERDFADPSRSFELTLDIPVLSDAVSIRKLREVAAEGENRQDPANEADADPPGLAVKLRPD